MSLTPPNEVELELLRKMIGVRCQKARERLGLSQRAVARAMDRSPSWVREIEAGQQFAPAYFIRTLAQATSLPVGWFYGDDAPDPGRYVRELIEAVTAHAVGRDVGVIPPG